MSNSHFQTLSRFQVSSFQDFTLLLLQTDRTQEAFIFVSVSKQILFLMERRKSDSTLLSSLENNKKPNKESHLDKLELILETQPLLYQLTATIQYIFLIIFFLIVLIDYYGRSWRWYCSFQRIY